ncbi:ParA family protein [Citrifermentans bremense]|uniref:ParA family protein n=1 Tax=Citrifermentans bremense TaxID=60035 RepID=UPI00041E39AC|nr:ParA family protein [Citrifermentans bremense]
MALLDDDLVGINEIAELAGVSRQAVANWRARFPDFPKPVADLRAGPVFRLRQIQGWLRRRNFPMARVVSLINLKGGVAKTTTTVALAETLAARFGKRVLVIDLDPQTNATVMLLGEARWKKLNENGYTLATLFQDALEPHDKRFNLEKTLQREVSDVQGAEKVDLLPSSLDLIDVQDKLASAPTGQFYSVTPIDLLRLAVKTKLDEYDLVLVDCPPNLGIITLNGLRISEGYLIPTVPDVLSTYGIPQIVKRVRNFSREIAEEITPLGIVITKFQANSTTHLNVSGNLRKENDPHVFDTVIRQADQIAAAAEFQSGRRTLKQKYGYGDLADRYVDLARELLKKLEIDE